MRYIVKEFDKPLLIFSADMNSSNSNLQIEKIYEENDAFFPLNLTVSNGGLESWLKHRVIPKNRAYVDALLSKTGLSANRPLGIIAVCKGLSLNDCYWVDSADNESSFAKVNLYDNRFSTILASIAFTGYGSSVRSSLFSSPEFSTNGMLPKCWRRINGKIYLYKGGTSGFSNTGFEPYSELYAYQIAKAMGINAIRYTLTKDLKKSLCSKCELFTSKDYSYMPIGQLVRKGNMEAIREYYQTLGQSFVDGYFLINAVVLLIQLQGTGFMIGVNASGTVNPMYEDLIAGSLGYSGTHQLSLFMTFVILYNMAYWKYEVPDLNKTPLLIYGHFLLCE